MTDPATQILGAVARYVGPVRDPLLQSTDWASATFSGARHIIWFTCAASATLEAFVHNLTAIELPLAGQFVGDIALHERFGNGDTVRLGLSVLTIET